jgi:hypothetical protein
MVGSRRLEVGKPAEHCRLQKPEMGNRETEFLKATLPAGNLPVEKVMVKAVERFPGQIFIGAIAKGDRGSRQEIVHPLSEARLFSLRGGKCGFNRMQYGSDAQAIRLGVAVGRARLELTLRGAAPKKLMNANPQKQLKHRLVRSAATAYSAMLQIALSWLGNH